MQSKRWSDKPGPRKSSFSKTRLASDEASGKALRGKRLPNGKKNRHRDRPGNNAESSSSGIKEPKNELKEESKTVGKEEPKEVENEEPTPVAEVKWTKKLPNGKKNKWTKAMKEAAKAAKEAANGSDKPINATNVPSGRKNAKEGEVKEEDSRLSRTIFVGNVKKGTTQQSIKRLAGKYGKVETVRIRGVFSEAPNVPKRAALLADRMHESIDTYSCYVVFGEPDGEESVMKACEELNMHELDGNNLRVTPAGKKIANHRQSVFVGNIPVNASEQTFLDAFQAAMEGSQYKITGARLLRDKATGIGRGIGLISFDDELGARYCSGLEGVKVGNRVVRISLAENQPPKSKKKLGSSDRIAKPPRRGAERRLLDRSKKKVKTTKTTL